MTIQENVALYKLTTLKVGGLARYVLTCSTKAEVEEAITFCEAHTLPFVVLGSGSNVLAHDSGFAGAVLRIDIQGITYEEDTERVLVTAGAGVAWESLVDAVTGKGLWGIENLAGIPGTVGAAPVQNIGAYGAELKSMFVEATVYNAKTHTWSTYASADCAFSYRDSIFKHNRDLIISAVTFSFTKQGSPQLGYSDLRSLERDGKDIETPRSIAEHVREIRSHKFPNLEEVGTAGSFFKNPIVSSDTFLELCNAFGSLPSFPVEAGVKIPLAYILDHILHLRGYKNGPVSLYGNQPLVLVAEHGATANAVDEFAIEIEEKVFDATHIRIEREVQKI